MNACLNLGGLRALVRLVVLAACLLPLSACAPNPKPPPPEPQASVVVTQDGMAFYVKGVRIPGTRQELRLKESGTLTWVPLEQVMGVWFQRTGPGHLSPGDHPPNRRRTAPGGGVCEFSHRRHH